MNKDKSLKIFMLHAVILMLGYTTIRYSLALFLQNSKNSPIEIFAITTSAFALQVMCSFFWSVILKYCKSPTYNRLVLNGGSMLVSGVLIISLFHKFEVAIIIGIATYIAGSSLYTVNINSLISAHTKDTVIRQSYTQKVFLCLNVGALFGLFTGAWLMSLVSTWLPEARYPILYLVSGGAILASLKLLESFKEQLCEIPIDEKSIYFRSTSWLPLFSLALIGLLVFCLLHASATRMIIVMAFALTFSYLLFGRKSSSSRSKLLLLVSSNLAYKTSLVIIYVSFSIFISHVSTLSLMGDKMPAIFFYMFDPVANLIVGFIFFKAIKPHLKGTEYICSFGLLVLALSFAVTMAGVWQMNQSNFHHINSLWIITAIFLFGAGEFLLAPTLQAQAANLAPHDAAIRSYQGLLELSGAAGMVIGFYMMSTTLKEGSASALLSHFQLYSFQFLLLLLFSVTMCAFTFVINHAKSKVLQHV